MGDFTGNGFDNEHPTHSVQTKDFFIGKYPVTQEQWMKIMEINPSFFQNNKNLPVESITFHNAMDFVARLNNITNETFRLPTEAEWEYAARSGGEKEIWAGTSDPAALNEYAWYDENSSARTQPVGLKKPNSLGMHDMSGNVCEWTTDIYNYYENKKMNTTSNDKSANNERVIRGGSWYNYALLLRCSDRSIYSSDYKDNYVGFRLVKSP